MKHAWLLIVLAVLLLPACNDTPASQSEAQDIEAIKQELSRLEREWLDAYDNDDVEAMGRILADDFTITYENGEVVTKAQTVAGLTDDDDEDDSEEQGSEEEDRSHYTENVTIRVYGNTAILSGVYVNPNDDGEPDDRSRYTDTYIKIDGRWQVVASQLTRLDNQSTDPNDQ